MLEPAFLQTIIDNPDDDVPRLILADWLDEQGDPRGMFIRIQCQLAQLAHGDPQAEALRAEEKRLYGPATDAFVRSALQTLRVFYDPYSAECGPGLYQRGLLSTVWLWPDDRLEQFIHHARHLFQRAPIQTIRFGPLIEDGGDIHRSATHAPTPVDKVRRFLQVPQLERVRDLELRSPFEDIDAVGRLLVKCPYLSNLSRLSFNRVYDFGNPFLVGEDHLLPRTQKLLRQRFGDRVSW
jgi:uncharacterized protein (TIGR02996 family)